MAAVVAHVAAIGLACPLGLRSQPALAAMAAGITRFVEVDNIDEADGSLKASLLGALDPALARAERIAWFGRLALAEALAGVEDPSPALRCVLSLPARGVGPPIDVAALQHALTDRLAPSAMQVIEEGRGGVFQALAAALVTLEREGSVVVGGVDSLVDPSTLATLASRRRLLGRTNLDGIIPGEGAAFVLLTHPTESPRRPPLALIHNVAVAREPQPFLAASPTIGGSSGLSAVFRTLGAGFSERVDEVFAATSGEVYFGREFTHAYLRNAALMPEPLRHNQLSAVLGDVGAAAGAIALVQAIARLGPRGPGNRGRPARLCLAYGSSDTGLVGGCVVGRAS